MIRPASEMSRVSTVTPAFDGIRPHDGQQRVRCQGGRLVRVGVDDGRVSHLSNIGYRQSLAACSYA